MVRLIKFFNISLKVIYILYMLFIEYVCELYFESWVLFYKMIGSRCLVYVIYIIIIFIFIDVCGLILLVCKEIVL